MKNLTYIFLSLFIFSSCSSKFDKLVEGYDNILPLEADFSELPTDVDTSNIISIVLTKITYTDNVFEYLYQYPSKKVEWSEEEIVKEANNTKFALENQLDFVDEYLIIKDSGRDIVFSYFDTDGVILFSIYYKQSKDELKYDEDLSAKFYDIRSKGN